jgi:hypothetical protein
MTQKTDHCPLCDSTSINKGLHLSDDESYGTCMWCCNPLCDGYVSRPGWVSTEWLYTSAPLAELPDHEAANYRRGQGAG